MTGPPCRLDYGGTASGRRRLRSNIPGLVCAFMASVTTGGTIYAFGIYGDALKKSLGLTQMQLNGISATFFIAGLFSWAPGLVVDRKGMRFSMTLGGCSGCFTTLLYWCVAREFIPFLAAKTSLVVPVLFLLAVLISLSCGLIVGSIFKLTLFCGGPHDKGSAVGIAKGFVGLGAGVYATIFQALRTPDQSALDFLPVIAFFFIICAALPAILLLPTKAEACPSLIVIETTPLHFRTLYTSLLLLGILIVVSSLSDILYYAEAGGDNPALNDGRNYGRVAIIVLLWLGPILSLLILPRKKDSALKTNHNEVFHITQDEECTDRMQNEEREKQQLLAKAKDSPIKQHPNYYNSTTNTDDTDQADQMAATDVGPLDLPPRHDSSLPEMLQSPSAWLMLWTCTILVGSGTSKTNNMGEMVEALGFDKAVNPATLAIFSVAQMSSRIITGVVSESALHWNVPSCHCSSNESNKRHGIPRPFFLVVASAISFAAHIMLTFATDQVSFVIGCTIAGIAFGMAWPLMVLIVGDIFGLEHHGANYMFYDGFTKAVGTLVLSTLVAGTVYDDHVIVNDDDIMNSDGASLCLGPECFRDTHLSIAGMALTGLVASVVLQMKTRTVYQNE